MYDGSFAGFDSSVIRIISHPEERVLGARLEYVRGVFDSLGRSMVNNDQLIRTVNEGVPFAGASTLKPGIILREYLQSGIPIDDIIEVNPLGSGNTKFFGLCTGLAVDVALAAVVASKCLGDFQLH